MGHRIAIMSAGRLQQIAAPIGSTSVPRTPSLRRSSATLACASRRASVDRGARSAWATHASRTARPGRPITVGVRPESLSLGTDGTAGVARVRRGPGCRRPRAVRPRGGERFVVRQSFDAPRPGPTSRCGSRSTPRATVGALLRRSQDRPCSTEARVKRGRRAEALLGYALLLPALVIFGVFTYFPFIRTFDIAAHKTPPYAYGKTKFDGPTQFLSVVTPRMFLDSLRSTVIFTVDRRAARHLPRARARGLRPPKAPRHGRLPGDLLLDGGHLVAVAAVIFNQILSPYNGLMQWLGVNTAPASQLSPVVGDRGGRRHPGVAVPGLLVHHHDRRPPVARPRRSSRRPGWTGRARGGSFWHVIVPLDVADDLLRCGHRHDRGAAELRGDRHHHRHRQRRLHAHERARSTTSIDSIGYAAERRPRPPACRSRCSSSRLFVTVVAVPACSNGGCTMAVDVRRPRDDAGRATSPARGDPARRVAVGDRWTYLCLGRRSRSSCSSRSTCSWSTPCSSQTSSSPIHQSSSRAPAVLQLQRRRWHDLRHRCATCATRRSRPASSSSPSS